MSKEEIISTITPMLGDGFIVKSIISVNHKPHPYMIGPKHIQNNSLDGDEIRRLEKTGVHCYQPGCTTSYDQHTYETGLFLSLTRNIPNGEAATTLKPVLEFIEAQGLCGICFVDTPEHYRIEKPEEES